VNIRGIAYTIKKLNLLKVSNTGKKHPFNNLKVDGVKCAKQSFHSLGQKKTAGLSDSSSLTHMHSLQSPLVFPSNRK